MAIKHVALTAVALAAAGAANAQSSVTLYGIVDAFVQYADGADSETRIQSGGLNGSRLGVRGSEDLGGGLRAIFTLESGVNLDDGTVGQGGVFWGRQAFVGLASNYGTLTLGRQYASVYTLTSDFSEYANGPYGASTAVIGGFGGYEPVRGASAAAGSSTGLGGPARVNNSIKYETPSLSGFKAGALLGLAENGASTSDNRTFDIYARYTAGPLDVMISYVDDKRDDPSAPATLLEAQTLSLAGAYSFGDFRVLGGYLKTEIDSAPDADGDGYWIGGDYRIGAHLIRAQFLANNPDVEEADTQAYSVGYQYDFSKRTAFYSALTFFKNEDRARWHGGIPTGLATSTDSDITEFVVGVRHAF